jgi:hypothetical protein
VLENAPESAYIRTMRARFRAGALWHARDMKRAAPDNSAVPSCTSTDEDDNRQAAVAPSTFLRSLYDRDPDVVTNTLERQAAFINRTLEYVLERLRVNAPTFFGSFNTKRCLEVFSHERMNVDMQASTADIASIAGSSA